MKLIVLRSFGMLAAALLPQVPLHAQSASAAAAGEFSWQRTTDSAALLRNGTVVWRFNHGTNQPKPHFHPLALPGGPVLTADRPADHPWHHALWFSWKYINGLNYWEPTAPAVQSQGRTEWRGAEVDTRGDFSARITMRIQYRPVDQNPVLTEQRVVEISTPDSQGSYRLDWHMTFTAPDRDVVLDRTAIPGEPGGVAWGGYAGLSVRFVNALSDVRAITSEGPITFSKGTYRGKSIGMDYSGLLEERGVGIAILDASGNLNHPSPWYAIHDATMRYFSPAVLCFQPHTIRAGQSLTLRYRVVVHAGRWDPERLRQAAAEYNEAIAASKPGAR